MAGTAGWTRPQEHDVRMRAWVWANENPGWVSAILDSVSARRESAWCVLIRTESKIGRNFGATALLLWDPPPFFLLLLFCRELRLLFLKALCVYDDEKSLGGSRGCVRGCALFSGKQEIAFSCRNFNKREREREDPFLQWKTHSLLRWNFCLSKNRKALDSILKMRLIWTHCENVWRAGHCSDWPYFLSWNWLRSSYFVCPTPTATFRFAPYRILGEF